MLLSKDMINEIEKIGKYKIKEVRIKERSFVSLYSYIFRELDTDRPEVDISFIIYKDKADKKLNSFSCVGIKISTTIKLINLLEKGVNDEKLQTK